MLSVVAPNLNSLQKISKSRSPDVRPSTISQVLQKHSKLFAQEQNKKKSPAHPHEVSQSALSEKQSLA